MSSLQECKTCSNTYSVNAVHCIHCGEPNPIRNNASPLCLNASSANNLLNIAEAEFDGSSDVSLSMHSNKLVLEKNCPPSAGAALLWAVFWWGCIYLLLGAGVVAADSDGIHGGVIALSVVALLAALYKAGDFLSIILRKTFRSDAYLSSLVLRVVDSKLSFKTDDEVLWENEINKITNLNKNV